MKPEQPTERETKPSPLIVGVQTAGGSSNKIYNACIRILEQENALGGSMVDIGGGAGSFSARVQERFDRVCLVDHSAPELMSIETRDSNLNVNRLCFLLRTQHQHFQDSCYPAHITPLLPIDLERISLELGQPSFFFTYTNETRIPGTKVRLQAFVPWAKGRGFSDNILFALRVRKPSL